MHKCRTKTLMTMINTAVFDDIRPYSPEELPAVFEELIADPEFKEAMKYALPQIPYEQICAVMRQSKTNLDFQYSILNNEFFEAGEVDTGFVERFLNGDL